MGSAGLAARQAITGPASTVSNVSVPLVPGWNPVGLQCQRVTALGPNPAIAGMATYAGGAYTVGPLDAASLNAGAGGRRGFMVFAAQATSLQYSGTDDGQGSFVDVQPGWQLVSFCTDQDIPSSRLSATQNGQTVALATVVLPTFYLATPSQNVPVDVNAGASLKAGGAYWVFANAAARLNLSAAPTPTPTASVTRLTLSPAGPVVVNLSSTATFTLTATFADGSRRDVTADALWTSLAPSVAALLSPGVFKGLNPFTTTIGASYGGTTAETSLQVVIVNTPGPAPSPSPRGKFTFPLVARGAGNTLRRFSETGAPLAPDPLSATAAQGDVGIPAVDGAGNVYFPTTAGNGVRKVDVTGAVTTFASGFGNTLEGCAFDGSGNLYVSQISPNRIVRIPPAGTPVTPFVTSGLTLPSGMAFDQAGNLYVADFGGGAVKSFDSTGSLRAGWGAAGQVSATSPVGLAFDSSGRLLVSESGANRVSRISADGSSITPLVTGVPNPSGLGMDQADNIYVMCSGTIQKFDGTGTLVNAAFITGLTTGLRGLALSP